VAVLNCFLLIKRCLRSLALKPPSLGVLRRLALPHRIPVLIPHLSKRRVLLGSREQNRALRHLRVKVATYPVEPGSCSGTRDAWIALKPRVGQCKSINRCPKRRNSASETTPICMASRMFTALPNCPTTICAVIMTFASASGFCFPPRKSLEKDIEKWGFVHFLSLLILGRYLKQVHSFHRSKPALSTDGPFI
jgi:hypothetical protein